MKLVVDNHYVIHGNFFKFEGFSGEYAVFFGTEEGTVEHYLTTDIESGKITVTEMENADA